MQYRFVAPMLLSLSVAAPAASVAASDEKPSFDKTDADGNGKVAISEATEAGVPKHEARREDLDDDGKLTRSDWEFIDMDPTVTKSGAA